MANFILGIGERTEVIRKEGEKMRIIISDQALHNLVKSLRVEKGLTLESAFVHGVCVYSIPNQALEKAVHLCVAVIKMLAKDQRFDNIELYISNKVELLPKGSVLKVFFTQELYSEMLDMFRHTKKVGLNLSDFSTIIEANRTDKYAYHFAFGSPYVSTLIELLAGLLPEPVCEGEDEEKAE